MARADYRPARPVATNQDSPGGALRWLGVWDTGADYAVNDVVSYDPGEGALSAGSYVATTAHTANDPAPLTDIGVGDIVEWAVSIGWEAIADGAVLPDDGSFASLTLGNAYTGGIKLDQAAPVYGWHDIIGGVYPKTSGAGTPALALYRAGGNVYQFAFAANDVVDFVFHIPHDYALGTDIFIHVHWSHNGTTVSGTATFQMYLTYAKGHNQAIFPAEVNPAVSYATVNVATTPQYRHRVDEVPCSTPGGSATRIDTDAIEPDGLLVGRCVLTSLPTLSAGAKLFVHTIDLHYQSTGISTKNKAPGFYT